eukprot:5835281-Pleurochrysis_carterae.AAC.1
MQSIACARRRLCRGSRRACGRWCRRGARCPASPRTWPAAATAVAVATAATGAQASVVMVAASAAMGATAVMSLEHSLASRELWLHCPHMVCSSLPPLPSTWEPAAKQPSSVENPVLAAELKRPPAS